MKYHYTSIRMGKTKQNRKQYQILARIWSNRNSHLLLGRPQTGATILENSLTLTANTKNT